MGEHSEYNVQEQALLGQFLEDNQLFYGPDPAILRSHSIGPRTEIEDRILSGPLDLHKMNLVRGRLIAALDEGFSMVEQMGAAPGAKWGDLVTGVFTASGDLATMGSRGIVAFAAACHYPVHFILKYWADDPSVGIRDGDAFMHNDCRYGGIHNTDQSTMLPIFYKDELVCWVSVTIHEGENGACEPGGMPTGAENVYDEGLMMSPIKIAENFMIRRDILTFLQNSVRDPKLQMEDTKVKLHAVLRLRERILAVIEEFGKEALIATLRKNLEDAETEVRRRIRELPEGTTRINAMIDSTLRENALIKVPLAITVKNGEMTVDLRGAAAQFMNRSINTNIASMKVALVTSFLQSIWPDLPHSMAVLSPIKVLTDEGSLLDATRETAQGMCLTPHFKIITIPVIAMTKLSYVLKRRYTAVIAPQYDQPATLIYGGLTQHNEAVGNFCADINGNGQGARSDRDGEHSVSPVFGYMCDLGEQELAEEEVPTIRLSSQRLAKDRVGFGKYRGGLGYEQIATVKDSNMWGFATGCSGSLFNPTTGLFGGYGSPVYCLGKIKGVNIFDVLKTRPDQFDFDLVTLMNQQAIPGARYSTHEMGMTFELVNQGEVYLLHQGGGAGYGDVLERDPELVMRDLQEELISHETAREIYFVVYNQKNLVLNVEATRQARAQERQARMQRGVPYHEFVKTWVTAEPPADLPYYGCWDNPQVIYAGVGENRVKMDAAHLRGVYMPDPQAVRIAQLEATVERLKAQLKSDRGKTC